MVSMRCTMPVVAVDVAGTRARDEEDSGVGVVAAHEETSVEDEDVAVANSAESSAAVEAGSVAPLAVVNLPLLRLHKTLDVFALRQRKMSQWPHRGSTGLSHLTKSFEAIGTA
jgi:hypothetical protein